MIKRAQIWFHHKNTHEQRIFITLFGCCLLAIFWFGAWQPLGQAIDTMQSRDEKLQLDIQWLHKQASAAGLLPQRTQSDSLETLVKRSLKKSGLNATLQPAHGGGLNISAATIKMDTFVRWLAVLQSEYGLHIVALEFHASKDDADSITLTRLTIGAKKNG
ncbi:MULTISPECIES: type II secretion system protein GspM [Citrobacter]|uniref:Cholera toxin secretion protein epsM n=2 Tax=Citrobacter freundii complex TaxID=1344959 RepID=A0A9N8CVV9_9ENTR|nr:MULTISPECIES: type II secretion system protein GspM [Citrobacter]AHY10769.1 hypothetical protein CFNIH1_04345 [Citrobacter freundii CFNIH1]MBD0821747.1 type II secretion system protein M [Citrobacter sp. C5_2]MBJ8374729.1 type II secretion system protein M [Citrobacter cronae]MBJ8388435.1 type II secretion system protein M [Citrobacter cronae]MBJ8393261.1 type II secretion system protein M [Citrobacter cronae]